MRKKLQDAYAAEAVPVGERSAKQRKLCEWLVKKRQGTRRRNTESRAERRAVKLAAHMARLRALMKTKTRGLLPCDRAALCEHLATIIVDLDEKRRTWCQARGLAEDHPLAINVFVVSEGGLNDATNTVKGEGEHSAVTTRGGYGPGVHWGTDGYERDLEPDELSKFGCGDDAFEVLDAELTSLLADLVEHGLHWLIELLAPHLRLQPLWRDAGKGGCRARGPYKVGVRFYALLQSGALPDGMGYHPNVTRTRF